MANTQQQQLTRILVQAAAAVCEDKKGDDTRILELDPIDAGLSDFFLVTSATNERQATAIADEIELRLKREFGARANSVEGRRKGEWILLDYVDFVVHVFLTERRAFYDIERLRKSARPLTPAEFDAELKTMLAEKTRAVRAHEPAKAAPVAKKKAAPEPAKAVAKKVPAKKAVAKKAPVKRAPARKAAVVKKAVVTKKPAVKKAAKPVATKKTAKPTPKKAAAKKAVAKKPVKKTAVKVPVAKKAAVKKPAKSLGKKAAAKKAPLKKAPVKKAAVKMPVAKKTAAKKAVAKKAVKKSAARKK